MWLKLFSQSIQNETVSTAGNIITLFDHNWQKPLHLNISNSIVIKDCDKYTYLGSIIIQEETSEEDIRH